MELSAVITKLEEQRRTPIVLFNNVKGTEFPTIVNVNASRKRIAAGMKTDLNKMREKYLVAVNNPIQPKYTSSAPVQDIIVKAVAIALKEHKIINSHFVNDEIITFEDINLGIAYATDAGLVVPVIKNADNKSIIDIAKNIRQFSKIEKTGFSPEDFNGGTFSITSLNSTVIDTFNPLLNPPQVGILGIGRTSEEVFFASGELKERKICSLNFTFDHRVIDGYPAARFMEFLVKVLNEPESIG